MRIFILIWIFIVTLFGISTNELAKFSANALYNLDNEQIKITLKPFLLNDSSIEAVKIIDYTDNSIFFKACKSDNKLVLLYNKLPKNLTSLKKEEQPIKEGDEIIGKIIVYRITNFSLTPKEKLWINTHIVTIGVEQWPPVVFSNNSIDIDGIAGDFTKLIIKKTGLNIKVINDKWSVILNKFKKHNIDILPATYYTKERAKYGLFSKPYFQMKNFLYVRKESKIKSFDDIKTLAIVKGYGTIPEIKSKFPHIKIIQTKDLLDSINHVLSKKVDALYDGQVVVSQTIMKNLITGLKPIPQSIFPPNNLHYFINNQKPILLSIIQKALNNITPDEKAKIISKWINSTNIITLTQKEKEWLAKNIIIKYTYDPDWKPIEWADDIKRPEGILKDVLNLIIQRTNLNIKMIYSKSWDDVLNKIKTNQANAYSTAKNNNPKLNFTKHSILKIPYVYVTRNDSDYIENITEIKNKKIGIFKNSSIHQLLKKDYPHLKLILFNKDIDGFKMLKNKSIDIAIFNFITAKYYLNSLGLNKDLKINDKSKYNLDLRIAVNKNLGKTVIDILDKGLASISKKEMGDIIDKWTEVKLKTKTNWELLIKIAIFFIFIVTLMLLYNYKLNTTVKEKTQELTSLLDSFDKHVIATKTDKNGLITYVSKAFCKISGYTKDELIGKPHNFVIHPDTNKEIFENIWNTINSGMIWKGELKSIKKNGDIYWVYTIITPEFNKNGDIIAFSGIRHDITDKKRVEDLTKNLEEKVKQRTKELAKAKEEIEKIHQHTKESIEFASLLQTSLLPKKTDIDKHFKDNFVYWKPKDIVGGDIYLFTELRHKNECLLMVIDCTGHGVPGAFVTMIVKAVEREIVKKIKNDKLIEVSPAWILEYFNNAIKKLLRQEDASSKSNAGFDGGVVYYNRNKQILRFAGAQTPLFYVEDGEVKVIKGDRYSVGYKKCEFDHKYKEHIIQVKEGMKFYLTTDGYLDQNGGEKDFPFGKKRFKKLIEKNYNLPMKTQKNIFIQTIENYKTDEQNDDITIVAFEIDKKSEIYEIFEYEGVLTQAIIAHHIDIIEHSIKDINIMSKLTTLIVEITQNMMKYSKTHEIGCRDIRPAGYIKVQQIAEKYIINSKNIISIEDKEKIERILNEITKLNEKEIKKRYRELRRNGEQSHQKGGGIGFYEIAKLSNNIEFNFTKINKDKFYFYFKISIKIKKRI